jgi:hypothetical protein
MSGSTRGTISKEVHGRQAAHSGSLLWLDLPPDIEQIAVFIFGSRSRTEIGGGRILMIADLMQESRNALITRSVSSVAVPEQYQLLRALQFATHKGQTGDHRGARAPSQSRSL